MIDSNAGLDYIPDLPEWARQRFEVSNIPRKATGARLFVLTWDNSRARSPKRRDGQPQTCEGCRFANGVVALDSGRGFETMSEMEQALGLAGNFTIEWEGSPDA